MNDRKEIIKRARETVERLDDAELIRELRRAYVGDDWVVPREKMTMKRSNISEEARAIAMQRYVDERIDEQVHAIIDVIGGESGTNEKALRSEMQSQIDMLVETVANLSARLDELAADLDSVERSGNVARLRA